MEKKGSGVFLIGFRDVPPAGETVLLAIQLILGLAGMFIFPGIMGRVFHLTGLQTAELYGATFIFSGLATAIQALWLPGIPVMSGPWAGAFAAFLALAHGYSFGILLGSLSVASLIWALLAIPVGRGLFVGFLDRYVRHPLLYGGITVIIMAQLSGITLPNWIGTAHTPGFGAPNWIGGALCIFVMGGLFIFARSRYLRRGAFLWGILVGTVAYALLTPLNLQPVAAYPWAFRPDFLSFGYSVSPVLVLFFFLIIVPTGIMSQYRLMAEWADEDVSNRRVAGGIFVTHLVSFVGSMFGTLNVGSYPDALGMLKVARVASIWISVVGGGILFCLGWFLKFDALFVVIPNSILSAGATILFGVVFVQAMASVARELDEMNTIVFGVSFMLALGGLFIKPASLAALPFFVRNAITSPALTGTVLLLVLHIVVNIWLRPRFERRGAAEAALPSQLSGAGR